MKRIRYLLDSGIEALVTPLSAFTVKALRDRAVTVHPDPDPDDTRYRVSAEDLPDGVTLPPGGIAGTETIEWQQDKRDAETAQSEWLMFAVIDLAVDFGDRDALVAQLANEREKLARYIDLPSDEWQATLRHCVLLSPNEAPDLFRIAAGQMALTEDEVAEGVRYFRPVLQGARRAGVARPASGAEGR